MSLLPKTISLQVCLLFSSWHFFCCQFNDTVCRVVAWVGCKGFFARCGGPERTPRHQRVKESGAQGYIVILETLGTPTGLSVPLRMLVVWCISALVHACMLFCIHMACAIWQFSFWGGGGVLWRAELGPEDKKQLKNLYTRRHTVGEGIDMQYCSNAGAHGTIKEEASSYNGQFLPQKNVGKGVRGWQCLRHGKGDFSCLADVNFFMW